MNIAKMYVSLWHWHICYFKLQMHSFKPGLHLHAVRLEWHMQNVLVHMLNTEQQETNHISSVVELTLAHVCFINFFFVSAICILQLVHLFHFFYFYCLLTVNIKKHKQIFIAKHIQCKVNYNIINFSSGR